MSATFVIFRDTYLPVRINVLQDDLANCNEGNLDTLYNGLYTIVNTTYLDFLATKTADPSGITAAKAATTEIFFKNAEAFATMYRNKMCSCQNYIDIISEIKHIFGSIKALL